MHALTRVGKAPRKICLCMPCTSRVCKYALTCCSSASRLDHHLLLSEVVLFSVCAENVLTCRLYQAGTWIELHACDILL
jgi:hypothetical protein